MRILIIDIPDLPRSVEPQYAKLSERKYQAYAYRLERLGPQAKEKYSKRNFTYGLLTISHNIPGVEVTYQHYLDIQSDNELRNMISKDTIIALSCLTPGYEILCNIVKRIVKLLEFKVRIVVGGYHATYLAEEVLNENLDISIVVRGPGAVAFREYVLGVSPEHIQGVSYRTSSGIRHTTMSHHLDLDIADYKLLPNHPGSYNYGVFASQGCQYKCDFCVNSRFWGTPTFRPIEQVLQEILLIADRVASGTIVHFTDNIFGWHEEYYLSLLNILGEAQTGLRFSCDARADCLSGRLIEAMAKTGFVKVALGFEDASDSILNKVGKTAVSKEYLATSHLVHQYSNMIVEAYWLVGLPGYNRFVFEQNKEFIYSLLEKRVVDIIATSLKFVPLPGTPIFESPWRYGVLLHETNWLDFLRSRYSFTYSLIDTPAYVLTDWLVEFDCFLCEYYENRMPIFRSSVS